MNDECCIKTDPFSHKLNEELYNFTIFEIVTFPTDPSQHQCGFTGKSRSGLRYNLWTNANFLRGLREIVYLKVNLHFLCFVIIAAQTNPLIVTQTGFKIQRAL